VLLPYVIYVIVLFIIKLIEIAFDSFLKQSFEFTEVIKVIGTSIYGGVKLNKIYAGPLWFLTCYYLTNVLANFVLKDGNHYKIIAIWLLLWTISHLQSIYLQHLVLPLEIDLVPIATCYFIIGYYLRKIIQKKYCLIGAAVAMVFFVALRALRIDAVTSYGLELVGHRYTNFILDAMIPTAIFVLLFYLCRLILNIKPVSQALIYIQKYSVPILALHIVCTTFLYNRILGITTKDYHWENQFCFCLIGLLVPVAIMNVIERISPRIASNMK